MGVGARSIAFPSISTGAFGFPIERAAPIAIREVKEGLARYPEIERVVLACFGAADLEVYDRRAAELLRKV